jgi:iron complex transport system ATP-binding protein
MTSFAPILEINKLNFSYGNKAVLSNISFCVSVGETWAIIGRNGAGKSTFIRSAAGLVPVSRGMIRINGKDLDNIGARERAKIFSYVPQANSRSLPSFSVFDYVMLGRFPYQGIMAVPNAKDRDIVSHALQLTDTHKLSCRYITTLSGGEIQRVFLAGAVAQQTAILLLDEPATFLDPLHQELVGKTLERIRKEFNTTIITVTHDINNAIFRNSNILALVDGTQFFAGTAKEFLAKSPAILNDVYAIPFEEAKSGDSLRRMFIAKEIP